jgi:hypothetical protein
MRNCNQNVMLQVRLFDWVHAKQWKVHHTYVYRHVHDTHTLTQLSVDCLYLAIEFLVFKNALGWGHGSSARGLASQALGPEFKPQYYQKIKRMPNLEFVRAYNWTDENLLNYRIAKIILINLICLKESIILRLLISIHITTIVVMQKLN